MVFLLFKTKIKGWAFNKNKDEHLTKTLEVFIKFVLIGIVIQSNNIEY